MDKKEVLRALFQRWKQGEVTADQYLREVGLLTRQETGCECQFDHVEGEHEWHCTVHKFVVVASKTHEPICCRSAACPMSRRT